MQRLIAGLALVFATTFAATAQNETPCPFGGREDCTGWCGRFTDNDGNGFCDYGVLSQKTIDSLNQAAKHKSTTPGNAKTDETEENTSPAARPTGNAKTDKAGGNTNPALRQTGNAKTDKAGENTNPASQQCGNTEKDKSSKPYDFILIACVTIGLYVLSAVLVKANVLKKATHRKIWNIVLLLSFLISCLVGLFMVVQINYRIALPALPTLRLHHVQFGIVMTLIAIFHILWHLPYFKNMFRQPK